MSSRRTSDSLFMWRTLGGTVLLAALAAIAGRAATADDRYTLAGDNVVIYNVAGAITVESGTGDQVLVTVRRGGRDAGQLKVETGGAGGAQTLRVIYPGGVVIYPPMGSSSTTTHWLGSDGRLDGAEWNLLGRRHITVRGAGRGLEAHADLQVLVPPGKRVSIYLCAGTAIARNVDGDLKLDGQHATLSAERIRGRLVLSTGSGSVRATDVQGEVVLDTGSGEVQVTGARGAKLKLDTGSGDITGVDIDVDELDGDTGSGGIRLDQVQADRILLDTGSGDVEVDLSGDVNDLYVDSGSGQVTVTCPKQLGASFDFETGSGRIELDVPHEASRVERDHVVGRFGDGRGRIRVESGSGSIRFRKRSLGGASFGPGAGRFFGYPVQ